MILIQTSGVTTFAATCSLNATITNPYYLFDFEHKLSNEHFYVIPYIEPWYTDYPPQWNLFNISVNIQQPESLTGNTLSGQTNVWLIPGEYFLKVYEQTSASNLNPSLSQGQIYQTMAKVDDYCDPLDQWSGETDQWIIYDDCAVVAASPTPSVTPTITPTVTNTKTPTPTPTITETPTNTPTVTPSETPTNTPTNTPTVTPTETPTNTPTVTPTVTPSITASLTPSVTPTFTPTPSATNPFNMNIGFGFDRQVNSITFDTNGDYYVAGTQWTYDQNYSRGFTKILSNGTFDNSFTCNVDADSSRSGYNLTLDNNNDLIVYGSFLNINGTGRQYIGKVNSGTGALYGSWTPTVGAQSVYDMFVDSNNDYWLWGSFTTVRDSGSAVNLTRNRIMKMDDAGIIFKDIFTGTGFNGVVQDVAFDGLGGMYCVGTFTTYNGVACSRIVKLDISTGNIDPSFVYGSGFNSVMYSVVYDPDGYIFVGGNAVTYNGTTTNKKLFKIGVDGVLDGTFVPTLTPGGVPTHTKVVLDTTNNCVYTSMYYIASNLYKFDRYTGTQDVSFTKQMQIWYNNSGGYKNFLLQPNGKIITVGNMTLYNNTNYNFIVRINPDGSSNTTTT